MAKSAIAKALEQIADKLVGVHVTELPPVTAEDEGDVLKVNNQGKWDKGSFTKELPDVTSADAGKVLTVSEDGEWVAAAPEAPSEE